ncbi:hypothetical protein S7711_10281 [Stachybotrys chartarum IBT 7711]|uniref:Uncharacterized protein n=1 Tax=Stachybotrys chartarum (strain CBS 109288 / IBT 7711) TaxID=1280523 RepID=A0A084B4W0_STACB|nr:hypothetical protein S7711_10281 [Stachybotrys chartarum IBT 7711]
MHQGFSRVLGLPCGCLIRTAVTITIVYAPF